MTTPTASAHAPNKTRKGKVIRRSKRYKAAAAAAGAARAVSIAEASTRVLAGATAKFPETIEMHIRLGIDPSKTDQNVRGTVSLPNGTGRAVRVAVFAQGDAAAAAKAAGAEIVGGAELVEKVAGGAVDFDVAIASPDMMREVGKLGRVLGPKGLMPNPKTGTVTADVASAVKEFKAGKVEFRSDKGACIHAPVGKSNFTADAIAGNADALLAAILRAKPDSAKGVYLRSVTLASTMGPGVRLDTAIVRRLAGAA